MFESVNEFNGKTVNKDNNTLLTKEPTDSLISGIV